MEFAPVFLIGQCQSGRSFVEASRLVADRQLCRGFASAGSSEFPDFRSLLGREKYIWRVQLPRVSMSSKRDEWHSSLQFLIGQWRKVGLLCFIGDGFVRSC